MNVLSLMSGTSLDGLDMAIAAFQLHEEEWSWRILGANTHAYPAKWRQRLLRAPELSGRELQGLHHEFGGYMADLVKEFLRMNPFPAELIASHGHTVFHKPEAGFTLQIGDAQVLAVQTGLPAVGNFRQLDMLYGGQGAPLVPFGDEALFREYDYCLNLGGFANISWSEHGQRRARDICPVNTVLNHFANELDLPFDRDGRAGRAGKLCTPLLESLAQIEYYRHGGPGSLSREWLEDTFLPLVASFRLPVTDVLHTLYEHISIQIAGMLQRRSRILLTGGGTHNDYLRERIAHHSRADLFVPDHELIDFKEALVFAFLGLLRYRNRINCLASVTGASRDSCTGVLYLP